MSTRYDCSVFLPWHLPGIIYDRHPNYTYGNLKFFFHNNPQIHRFGFFKFFLTKMYTHFAQKLHLVRYSPLLMDVIILKFQWTLNINVGRCINKVCALLKSSNGWTHIKQCGLSLFSIYIVLCLIVYCNSFLLMFERRYRHQSVAIDTTSGTSYRSINLGERSLIPDLILLYGFRLSLHI